jgi:cyclophilin family peptidyl-prolyl cis-trans isomerase
LTNNIVKQIHHLRLSGCRFKKKSNFIAMNFVIDFKKQALLIIILFGLFSCTNKKESINKFSDPSLLAIAKYQDSRNSKGLIPYLKAKKPIHREAAVRAFASIQDTALKKYLFTTLYTDQVANIRGTAAYAIGQLRDSSCATQLMKALGLELDTKVQKQILIALGKCADQSVMNLLADFKQYNSELEEGHAIAIMQSTRKGKITPSHAEACMRYLLASNSSPIAKFYSAFALSRMKKTLTAPYCNRIEQIADTTTNRDISIALERLCRESKVESKEPYSTGMFDSFQENPYAMASRMVKIDFSEEAGLKFLMNQSKNSLHQIVRTTAADQYFRQLPRPIADSTIYHGFIGFALNSKDMALQSHAAIELQKVLDPLNFEMYVPILQKQIDDLALPRQAETFIDLNKALAHLTSEPEVKLAPSVLHKINWDEVVLIPRDQQVMIKTSKGDIIVQLFVENAPGSVWNFLNSVDNNDYSNRYFHRVVPNFVIQGGCPRGDGWGAPNWTQRSEFSDLKPFIQGAVGLASVGNDTEGFQFFITHCATPHLDGRYTVFGQVISGFEVVDQIEVGDIILSVDRIYPVLEIDS